MGWITYSAIYFITWWITLFAILPVGLRTQDEAGEVAPGTVESAPAGAHVRRAMLWTTIVAALVCLALFIVVDVFEIGLDNIPKFIPDA